MKVTNMRIRIDSVWRDIKEFSCEHGRMTAIANNDDKFEIDKSKTHADTALVISVDDLFTLIGDLVENDNTEKPKKTTKKKATTDSNDNKIEG